MCARSRTHLPRADGPEMPLLRGRSFFSVKARAESADEMTRDKLTDAMRVVGRGGTCHSQAHGGECGTGTHPGYESIQLLSDVIQRNGSLAAVQYSLVSLSLRCKSPVCCGHR